MQSAPIINAFKRVLGESNIAVGQRQTEHYRKGWRSGEGEALAVLFPHTLMQYWEALNVCVEYNCIIIMQAAKTGLTEGSTPSGEDYDRPVVVINTLAMDDIVLLNKGKQVLSFPGATLFKLEKVLKPLGRAPHSVIGSSCLGASIVGGVANNSGGALVKRGPAYTELSLFAQVDQNGELTLVNHLGIDLGETSEEIIGNLSSGNFPTTLPATEKKASASDYVHIVRDVNADTPSRFNADPTRLYEASGCAGKIAVFAVRLDTFEVPTNEQTFYIGTNDAAVLTRIRRDILSQFDNVPEVGEYLHREMFDIADIYGKDTILSIQRLGTDSLPKMFALKGRVDGVLNKLPLLPPYFSDRVMQFGSKFFPDQIPQSLRTFRNKYEHHLILKMSDGGIEEAKALLSKLFTQEQLDGGYIECSDEEAAKAFLLRFAAAGAAVRYQTLHHKQVGDILALDIALRRNDEFWVEKLPAHIAMHVEKPLYYGHFFCHVFHQDYILKKGSDAKKVKADMLALLDSRGAKYPAEHNVGHLYEAEDTLQQFYRELDPTNTFNPGIGKMEKHKRNCSCCV
ncbi:D-lactate dehydrogenase [Alteromonas mediterranea]|uniref:D-lactate dehydrogenase n=1 Tax=Alteromonas mediterranea TaxID=314275 RepID=UPI00090321CB|nr:D-lactate dehydrogenase [Alteromonas mediterranea]APD94655.1 D-lactate dehydrogenase [Alteromonas mediterranea]APD98291.1 D-lactate dehydrogenase [Alteromonas mediterranea]